MIAEFNETNECGITVEALNQGGYNDIRDKMNAGIATGDLPGLVVGYQNDQAFYALGDGLADIEPYFSDATWGLSDADKADFFAPFLDQGIHPAFGSQRLGFPPNRSVEGIFYNLTWLQELGFDGPPTTPDEFKAMACAAAEANGDGTGGYILRDDASAVAAWTFAFGGDVLTEDGTGYVYNSQATVDAFTFLRDLNEEGCAYFFTEGYPNPEFAARRAIFTQGSSSGLPFYASDLATVADRKGHRARRVGLYRPAAHHRRSHHRHLWRRRHDPGHQSRNPARRLDLCQVAHLARKAGRVGPHQQLLPHPRLHVRLLGRLYQREPAVGPGI